MGQALATSFVWTHPAPTPPESCAEEEEEEQEGASGVAVGGGDIPCGGFAFPMQLTCEGAKAPEHATSGAAGHDLTAATQATLASGERKLIGTGVKLVMKDTLNTLLAPDTVIEGMVRGRSGLAKRGIDVFNGTIDCDYRGEIKVLLINNSAETFEVAIGDRIAQLVFAVALTPRFVPCDDVEALFTTERGGKGFGSTGV